MEIGNDYYDSWTTSFYGKEDFKWSDFESGDTDIKYYVLYFHDWFKKYNGVVTTSRRNEALFYNEGDKFYLVFVKGLQSPFICKDNNYILSDEERAKLRSSDAIGDYINISKFKLESAPIQGPIYN